MSEWPDFQIPTEWSLTRMDELATKLKAGGTPSRQNKANFGGDVPFVLIDDMTSSGVYLKSTKETITRGGLESCSAWIVPENTVLLSMYATIGATVITTFPVATNQAILAIIPREDCDREYLSFCLQAHKRHLARLNVESTQKNINKGIVSSFPLPLPPLPEQKKIAHILSTVQRAIEAQERIIQTTTELKKALMHKLFTEGLRQEPQKQTEIGPVPESWSPITLGELCGKPNGALQTGPFGSQLHKHEYQEDGIAVVNPTHLAGNRINHENVPRVSEQVAQRLGKHRLRKFDILFARRGEIGRQGLVTDAEETWLCGTGCFLVRASKPFIDNRFLALYFATDRLVKWLYSHAAGAIMPNLNNAVMQRLPVFYPDLHSQTTIIETFATIDQKLSAAEGRQTALQDLFRTLLNELMTAKIRVHELDFSTGEHPA
jgi:type I restriction enzyme S subunit